MNPLISRFNQKGLLEFLHSFDSDVCFDTVKLNKQFYNMKIIVKNDVKYEPGARPLIPLHIITIRVERIEVQ